MKNSQLGWVSVLSSFMIAACASEHAPIATTSPIDKNQTLMASNDAPATAKRPCKQGFATSIISLKYGEGSGYGQDMAQFRINPALGAPQGEGLYNGGLNVLTLGLGGSIVLGFGDDDNANKGIGDETGADFIVFENVFKINKTETYYVELGQVSVSEDGDEWKTFPCDKAKSPYSGCAGTLPTLSRIDNGISAFDPANAGGDTFDLATVGVTFAKHVRIEDLMAPGQATGFDLDAVSVVHPDCDH